ncbi:DUF6263 family protein [candidate division KSB1 bacterium]
MVKKNVVITIALLLLISLGCGTTKNVTSAHQGEIDLKLNFNKEDKFSLATEMKTRIGMDIMGMPMDMDMVYTMENDYFVEEISSDNIAKIRSRFTRIYMKMDMGVMAGAAGAVEFDSDKGADPNNPMGDTLKKLIDKDFYIYLNSAGEITKTEGMKELFSAMMGDMGGGLGNLPSFGSFDDKMFTQNMDIVFNLFSGKPVKTGDSWEKANEGAAGMGMDKKSTYTLTSRSNGISNIDVQSELVMKPDMSMLEALGVTDAAFSMKGTETGKIAVDEKTGLANNGSFNQKMSGSLDMTNPEDPNQVINMFFSMDGTTTFTFKK